ncbi:MAG: SMC family ATPase [Desulfatiglans sp.]|nr:SMC family ATPase [Desulfatiglans sp.]
MQIISVHLKNIKPHRDKELHFVKGINVLSGNNGAGKSTILEAIGYALFGVDARDFVGNIDRFITIGEKRGEVTVTFVAYDGETYKVSRSVGSSSKWLLYREIGGSFEVEEHAGFDETEARIKGLLGLDSGRPLADQYKLVIGPFQNEFLGPFIIKQTTKRQEAFDEILGIDAWRKTYKGTSTMLSSVKNRIEVMKAEIEGREAQVAKLPDKKKEVKALITIIETEQKNLAENQNALTKKEKELAGLDKQEKDITSIKNEIRILENRMQDGKGKIIDQEKQVKESEKAIELMEKSRAGKEAFEKAEANLKILRDLEKERRVIEKSINELEKENSSLKQKITHEGQEIAKADKLYAEEEGRLKREQSELIPDKRLNEAAVRLPALKKAEKELSLLKGALTGRLDGLNEGKEKLAEGVCPFFREQCQNIIDKKPADIFTARMDEIAKEAISLDKRLDELGKEIKEAEKANKELDAIKVKSESIEKQLTALIKKREDNIKRNGELEKTVKQQQEAEMKTVAAKADLEKYTKLDAEILTAERVKIENQAARDAFFTNEKEAKDLENRKESLQKMLKLMDELKKSLITNQTLYEKIEKEYNSKQHAEVRALKEKLVGDTAAIKQKIDSMNRDKLRLEEEIKRMEQIKKEINDRLAQRKKMEQKEELVKFLRNKIFNNVSAQLSERFREEISLRADIIYRNIAESDEELFWGDKYQIVLRDMQDGEIRERTDDQLSGGQIMSAVVALRLALLQTIGARIAFFDEPTSNLDAARRLNLAHAFRAIDIGQEEVTEHWYDQLFLISHDVNFTEITDQIISL